MTPDAVISRQAPLRSSLTRPQSVPVDDAWKALDLAIGWIKHAETKAVANLAGAGVVGGILYNLAKGHSDVRGWYLAAALVCAAAMLVAAVSAGIALRPRLRVRGHQSNRLYFGATRASGATAAAYLPALRALISDPEALLEEISEQVWVNSYIAGAKYRWAAIASGATLVGLVALGATAMIGLVG